MVEIVVRSCNASLVKPLTSYASYIVASALGDQLYALESCKFFKKRFLKFLLFPIKKKKKLCIQSNSQVFNFHLLCKLFKLCTLKYCGISVTKYKQMLMKFTIFGEILNPQTSQLWEMQCCFAFLITKCCLPLPNLTPLPSKEKSPSGLVDFRYKGQDVSVLHFKL